MTLQPNFAIERAENHERSDASAWQPINDEFLPQHGKGAGKGPGRSAKGASSAPEPAAPPVVPVGTAAEGDSFAPTPPEVPTGKAGRRGRKAQAPKPLPEPKKEKKAKAKDTKKAEATADDAGSRRRGLRSRKASAEPVAPALPDAPVVPFEAPAAPPVFVP